LGAPQRRRPACPQLPGHLVVTTYTYSAQTHTHTSNRLTYSAQALTTNTHTATGKAQKGEQQHADSGGKENFYLLNYTKYNSIV